MHIRDRNERPISHGHFWILPISLVLNKVAAGSKNLRKVYLNLHLVHLNLQLFRRMRVDLILHYVSNLDKTIRHLLINQASKDFF